MVDHVLVLKDHRPFQTNCIKITIATIQFEKRMKKNCYTSKKRKRLSYFFTAVRFKNKLAKSEKQEWDGIRGTP